MTPRQKALVIDLLQGHYIIICRNPKGNRQAKLFRGNRDPVRWLYSKDTKGVPLRWADKAKTQEVPREIYLRAQALLDKYPSSK